MKAVITVGCSASGKSTYADKLETQDYVRIERDLIRENILSKKISGLYSIKENLYRYWKFKWETEVTEKFNELLSVAMSNKRKIIISDTNLNIDRRNILVKTLTDAGYEVEIKVFGEDLSLKELWKRDTYRKNTVGHHVIARQYDQFRKEFPLYVLKVVPNGESAIIFDIDGTLAEMNGRGPYEWSKVGQDFHNDILFNLMSSCHYDGHNIIIMSGRDEICRNETVEWLDDWFSRNSPGLKYNLYMRKQDDSRKDSIIKMELFKEHVDGKYTVEAVFDDRPSVCRDVWMELGFRVYHCANPYLEF